MTTIRTFARRIALLLGTTAVIGVSGLAAGSAQAASTQTTTGGLSCQTWIDDATGVARCHNADVRTWQVRLQLDCAAPLPDVRTDWIPIRPGQSVTLAATCGSGSVVDLRLERR